MSSPSRLWSRLRPVARAVGSFLAPLLVVAAFLVGVVVAAPAPDRPGPDHGHGGAQAWTCSMHPQIQLPEPGDCPICGMDLIPLKPSSQRSSDQITLSREAVALAGLRTVEVRPGSPAGTLRLLGKLEVDETRTRTLSSWVAGRIDRLYVSATGIQVKRGATLASIYSPEVYAAHADLLQARRQVEKLAGALPVARSAARSAVEAAETRLELLGFGKATVKKMGEASRPYRSVAVSAHYGGTVLKQLVTQGDYVSAGQALYRIADLETLWIQLDAYETDLPHIRRTDRVLVKVAGIPDEVFEGQVSFIDPVVDPQTRTVQVRVEVKNESEQLRPGLFAEATIQRSGSQEASPLVIPASAPLFTGKRSVVYVEVPAADRPTYEARNVQLGPEQGGAYRVVSGLKAGERVVVHGAFAIDAELQIAGGDSMMARDDDLSRPEELTWTDQGKAAARALLTPYLELQRALAADDPTAARTAMKDLHQAATARPPLAPGATKAWNAATDSIGKNTPDVARAPIKELRRRNLALSRAVLDLLERFPNPVNQALRVAFCPMADEGKGARWVQSGEAVRNPYYGSSMLTCGSVLQTLSPGSRAAPPKP